MKDLFYRGRNEKGVWFEGFYSLINDGHGMKPAIITGTEKGCFIPEFVVYKTLGQDTGFVDVDKVKIFEDDLVLCDNNLTRVVQWCAEEGCFKLHCIDVQEYHGSDYMNGNKFMKVVGNVYDSWLRMREVEE